MVSRFEALLAENLFSEISTAGTAVGMTVSAGASVIGRAFRLLNWRILDGPPIRTSLLATETWTPGAVAGPPIRVSCLVTETWISTTPMTNKPQLLLM
jgi:hypothetical protein